jgi:hypothetical protein
VAFNLIIVDTVTAQPPSPEGADPPLEQAPPTTVDEMLTGGVAERAQPPAALPPQPAAACRSQAECGDAGADHAASIHAFRVARGRVIANRWWVTLGASGAVSLMGGAGLSAWSASLDCEECVDSGAERGGTIALGISAAVVAVLTIAAGVRLHQWKNARDRRQDDLVVAGLTVPDRRLSMPGRFFVGGGVVLTVAGAMGLGAGLIARKAAASIVGAVMAAGFTGLTVLAVARRRCSTSRGRGCRSRVALSLSPAGLVLSL